jgi:hypothetical protein
MKGGKVVLKAALVFVLGVVFSVTTSGCAAAPILLRNDKGEIAKCESSGTMAMYGGYFGTRHQVSKCAEQYEAAGYKRVK